MLVVLQDRLRIFRRQSRPYIELGSHVVVEEERDVVMMSLKILISYLNEDLINSDVFCQLLN